MNDGIKPELCSLSYPSVEEVASMACSIGLHALMAKMDLKNAYQMMPLHADNQLLLKLPVLMCVTRAPETRNTRNVCGVLLFDMCTIILLNWMPAPIIMV